MKKNPSTVSDIMTTSVISVSPDMTIGAIAKILVDNHLTGVPVVDGDRQVLGLITDRDLVSHQALVHLPTVLDILGTTVVVSDPAHTNQELKDVLALSAKDLMRTDVPLLTEVMSVREAATILRDSGVNPLPVVHDQVMVGIISRHDILTVLIAHQGDE